MPHLLTVAGIVSPTMTESTIEARKPRCIARPVSFDAIRSPCCRSTACCRFRRPRRERIARGVVFREVSVNLALLANGCVRRVRGQSSNLHRGLGLVDHDESVVA